MDFNACLPEAFSPAKELVRRESGRRQALGRARTDLPVKCYFIKNSCSFKQSMVTITKFWVTAQEGVIR